MKLDDFGARICIMGPSNSGTSTLAVAMASARQLPVIHLDQLHHLPHTDWVRPPADEFAALHDKAIAGDPWVIEGNYSRLLHQRLKRATGFILLDLSTSTSLFRYVRRCWFERDRPGGLEGGRDSVKWEMIHHIVVTNRASRRGYQAMFDGVTLPKVWLRSPPQLASFYQSNRLIR